MAEDACALRARADRPLALVEPAEGLARSLRALGHPLTAACVLLLLLNDHLLKAISPSPLTGKLSDFAGLFFFPFLLAAFLGAVRLRRLGPVAHLLTGVLFAWLKLSPGLNGTVNAALRSTSGLPIHFTRDPTDLVALLALIPSYLLWKSDRRRPPLRRSLAVLGLASLAALATTPCEPEQPITHLISHDGSLYAVATAWEPASNAFLATDLGRRWEYIDPESLPEAVLEAASVPVPLPKTACVPGLPQVCYRAAGQEWLEVSRDGGGTWAIAWEVSQARRAYMERVASGYGQLLACGKTLDLRATDLAILGEGPQHMVVVALGNEGVLRGRYDQAEWTRIGVGWAEPSAALGDLGDLFPPLILFGETSRAVIAGAGLFLLLSAISWIRLGADADESRDGDSARKPWVVAGLVVLALIVLMALAGMWDLIPAVLPTLLGFAAVAAAITARWRRAYRQTRRPDDARRSLRISIAGSLLAAAALWIPFALWVVAIIPGYSAAFWLALVGAVAAPVWSVGRLPKAGRPSPAPDQPLS